MPYHFLVKFSSSLLNPHSQLHISTSIIQPLPLPNLHNIVYPGIDGFSDSSG